MKPEGIAAIVTGLKEAGINFVTSLSCTAFKLVIPAIMADPYFTHVPVCNEGDAIGICGGASLVGKKPALLAENSALILASHALMGWSRFGSFPMLLLLDHKGDFGEGDGAWYFGGGRLTPPTLDTLDIPYTIVREANKFTTEIVRGQKTTEAYRKPVAVLFSGEEVW